MSSRQLSAWVIMDILDAVITVRPLGEAQRALPDDADAWRTQLQTASLLLPQIL